MNSRDWEVLAAVAYNDGVWSGGWSIYFNGLKITRDEFITVRDKYYE